jgi:hypothetical protein
MKYSRFEELPVWQDAIELAIRIFELTDHAEFKGYFTQGSNRKSRRFSF